MESTLPYKIDVQRRLCIKKDMVELSHWINTIENINVELNYLSVIEKQLLKNSSIVKNSQGLRRKNTLIMASFCQYEQQLRTEFEYGKREYDTLRVKGHDRKRDDYSLLIQEFWKLKTSIYKMLLMFKRK